MMKRDKVVFENEKFEVTGYDIWMTAGEIAELFGVTIMKVRGIINRMRKQLTVSPKILEKSVFHRFLSHFHKYTFLFSF